EDITRCQKELVGMKMPALPIGFIDFLRVANGFVWDGVYFYSTDEVVNEEENFTLSDIITANEIFQENREMPDKFLLGFSDEDIFTYDIKQGKYEILDFTSCEQMKEFETFKDLFCDVVGERLDVSDT
ncbi:MAG: YrhA family protein, partial [Alphaproteobacteria bacterium]|nr:YrhA family protein [Alphaproteobacteria bacterium]